jgi:hypothetical protein
MEMDLPSVGPREIELVARVRIESSAVTRRARTAKALAVLLGGNRDRPANGFGEARADLRFDPHAGGTQVICLQLGDLSADPTGLSRLPSGSVEETQIDCGHQVPPVRVSKKSLTTR